MIIFFCYLFYVIAASASPLQRRWLAKVKDFDPKDQISFSFHVLIFLVLGSLAFPFFSPFYFSGGALRLLLLSLTCGIFGGVCFVLNYIAQKHVEASVTSIVMNIYTPITIILSSIFLHEGLTSIQIIGTILLLVALFVVSKKHHMGRFRFDKYFIYMVMSGLMMGVLLVAERALQKVTGFSAGTMLSWWSQFIFLGLLTLIYKSKHAYTKKEITITGFLRFLQALSYVVLVYLVGNLSLVSSVITFKVVVVFIAAAIFLHEREDLPRKILGSVLALIGLLLM